GQRDRRWRRRIGGRAGGGGRPRDVGRHRGVEGTHRVAVQRGRHEAGIRVVRRRDGGDGRGATVAEYAVTRHSGAGVGRCRPGEIDPGVRGRGGRESGRHGGRRGVDRWCGVGRRTGGDRRRGFVGGRRGVEGTHRVAVQRGRGQIGVR